MLNSFSGIKKTMYEQLKSHLTSFLKNSAYKTRKYWEGRKIVKIDDRDIPDDTSEIRLFGIMRNESLRLPHFIAFYKQLKVDRFFLISNNSTDDCIDVALSYDQVHVFKINSSYVHHWCWMENLLEAYGRGHWCVVVDIDELICFPNIEQLSIKDLCSYFDQTGATAYRSLLLDMYSDTSILNTTYEAGQNPLEVIPYFDKEYRRINYKFFDRYKWLPFESDTLVGGMRERVFGKTHTQALLSKISIFKFIPDTYLAQGMHAINGAKIGDIQGVVFHTKFLSDFINEVAEECERMEHYGGAIYYKLFKRTLKSNPFIELFHEGSIYFTNSEQLVDLGLMMKTSRFEEFIHQKLLHTR